MAKKMFIKMPHGNRQKVAKIFDISQPHIRKVLNYEKVENEDRAKKIRHVALTHYGGYNVTMEVEEPKIKY